MQRSILKDLLILLGVFALIWLLASLFNYPEDPQLLSIEKEERLGDAYVDLILLNPMFSELAAVMAHEMGHVEERHVVSRLVKELGLDILTSGDQFVIGEVTGLLTSTSFDRKQEEEADRFAAELLERASIEPRTMATLFRKLEEETDNELLEHFEIISTHPNFSSRIREALSCKPGDDFESLPVNLDWEGIKDGL